MSGWEKEPITPWGDKKEGTKMIIDPEIFADPVDPKAEKAEKRRKIKETRNKKIEAIRRTGTEGRLTGDFLETVKGQIADAEDALQKLDKEE